MVQDLKKGNNCAAPCNGVFFFHEPLTSQVSQVLSQVLTPMAVVTPGPARTPLPNKNIHEHDDAEGCSLRQLDCFPRVASPILGGGSGSGRPKETRC